jgi:hypothetical protein
LRKKQNIKKERYHMAGGAKSSKGGKALVTRVVEIAEKLGLEAKKEVSVGRRLWGAIRNIDVVLTDKTTRKSLGIECKYQEVGGSAEEKIPTTIKDIDAWPISGLLVFDGPGFSANMKGYLYSTGKAIAFSDLEQWLKLFLGLS